MFCSPKSKLSSVYCMLTMVVAWQPALSLERIPVFLSENWYNVSVEVNRTINLVFLVGSCWQILVVSRKAQKRCFFFLKAIVYGKWIRLKFKSWCLVKRYVIMSSRFSVSRCLSCCINCCSTKIFFPVYLYINLKSKWGLEWHFN